MILPQRTDAIHRAWLYRLLEAIADEPYLASVLYFKGGTCASMLGWLDRFSVDLDFDYVGAETDIRQTRTALEQIFHKLGLSIKDASTRGIQYFLRYENPSGRNTLRLDTAFPVFKNNAYAKQRFIEIDRILICQTKETMFANKLIALRARYKKTGAIAGRDVYDVHYFFLHGYRYNEAALKEYANGGDVRAFFADLLSFVEKNVTETIIREDLSTLLPPEKFSLIRKVLKKEVVIFLRQEIERLTDLAE